MISQPIFACLHSYEWKRDIAVLEIVYLYISWFIEKTYAFLKFAANYITAMFPGKILGNIYPKNFVTFSLLMRIFSITMLGKACGRNFLFERGWNNDHLVSRRFKDNFFDLKQDETLWSSAFILATSVSMVLWQRNKSYHQKTYFPFDALNKLFK